MVTDSGDLLNAGEVVESLGRAWTLSHVGPAIRAKFSAWLKGRARREAEGDRFLTGAYMESVAAGAYNWGSPLDHACGFGSAVRAAISEPEGQTRLLQLLLEPAHGEVSTETVAALYRDQAAQIGEAVRLCMHLPERPQGPDPNGSPTHPPGEAGPTTGCPPRRPTNARG